MPNRRSAGPFVAAVLLLSAGVLADPPSWVERHPDRPDQHIGIGRADKAGHPLDYRAAAQAAALSQISREISIAIRTETLSTREEGEGGGSGSFSQTIQGFSANELAGYVLVDQYETPESLWLYYALDKEEFRRAMLEREREAEAWRKAALRVEPAVWAFKGLEAEGTGKAHVILVTGLPLDSRRGSISLSLSRRSSSRGISCAIETGPAGEVDMEEAFATCGLEPGAWRILWSGPEGRKAQGEVRIQVTRAERSFTVRAKDMAGWKAARWEAELSEEMTDRESPRIRWSSAASREIPSMEIGLRQATVDSLDGIHFTALRGWIRPPGSAAPREIHGKAGHADPAVSRERALRDFAREAASRADPQGVRREVR